MVEHPRFNSGSMMFLPSLVTPRQTAAFLAGMITESGSQVPLNTKCPSVSTLQKVQDTDELTESLGMYYFALNKSTIWRMWGL